MDSKLDSRLVPPVQNGGTSSRMILVIFGHALRESRTGQVLEELAPADGTVIEATPGCLRSRRQMVRMARLLADHRGPAHRTLLLRRLDRMPPQGMRHLAAWVRNRRLNAEWHVVTCVAPRGAPDLERSARHIERCLAPDLVIDLRTVSNSRAGFSSDSG